MFGHKYDEQLNNIFQNFERVNRLAPDASSALKDEIQRLKDQYQQNLDALSAVSSLVNDNKLSMRMYMLNALDQGRLSAAFQNIVMMQKALDDHIEKSTQLATQNKKLASTIDQLERQAQAVASEAKSKNRASELMAYQKDLQINLRALDKYVDDKKSKKNVSPKIMLIKNFILPLMAKFNDAKTLESLVLLAKGLENTLKDYMQHVPKRGLNIGSFRIKSDLDRGNTLIALTLQALSKVTMGLQYAVGEKQDLSLHLVNEAEDLQVAVRQRK